MKLKLTYETFNDASLLPKADVTISGLGITLTYTQDGNAKVNADGTTPLDPYSHHVGDAITVAGETYYVITNSPITDDYVVALKANPLTVSEIIAPQGVTVTDINGDGSIGGIKFGDNNSYESSCVKSVIESWSSITFTNQLKTVNGYNARLLNREEIEIVIGQYDPCGGCGAEATGEIVKYDWMYDNNYLYWLMNPTVDSPNYAWSINTGGHLYDSYVLNSNAVVRPVINVYKSAISS